MAASLKRANTTDAILNVTNDAARQAARAGECGVELFSDARALTAAEVLRDIPRQVQGVLREGTIAFVNVEPKNG